MRKDFRVKEVWDENQWDLWGLDRPEWSHVKTGAQSGKGRRVIFDIEADGLLEATGEPGSKSRKEEATQFWCIAAVDVDSGEEFYWGAEQDSPHWIVEALNFLGECDLLLGHNAIGFDYPVCEKLYGWTRPEKAWDTLPICKVIWPYDSLIGPDLTRIRAGKMPGQLLKRQSLEAWGYRTGTFKGHYTGGFHAWCPAMAVYLMGDIRGTLALWRLIEKRIGWKDPKPGDLVWPELTLETECFVANVIFQQEKRGTRFDVKAAEALSADLSNQKAGLERRLKEAFGEWWQRSPEVTPKADRSMTMTGWPNITIRRYGKNGKELKPYVGPPQCIYTADAPYTPIERMVYNPSSRQHLALRLQDLYGWEPKEFGGKDMKDPKVSETVLEAIPDAVMPAALRELIMDYFVVSKTLATLAHGNKAWIKMASGPTNKDPWHIPGRIHGRMDTCGAVTRRGTHNDPNISGTPKVLFAKQPDGTEVPLMGRAGKFGWECRALFICEEGEEETGVDAASLELITLGHYLYPIDGGAFSARVCDPTRDSHTEHAAICQVTRNDAKTTIYLFIYGGSAYKLSLDPAIKVDLSDVPQLLTYKGLGMLLKSLRERMGDNFVDNMDDVQKARVAHCRQVIIKLEAGIEGLKDLKKGVAERAKDQKWLKAMDGTRIVVRKDYASLNALLQSAGAISCKLWMMLLHKEMKRRGYVHWKDYSQMLWAHDEFQFSHRPGLGPVIAEVADLTLKEAGRVLGLRGEYRTGTKHGKNWAECH